MSRAVVVAILGVVATVVVSIVTAATYVGALAERLKNIDEGVDQTIDAFITAPRRPGSEIKFSENGPWGRWSDPVFCPQGHYVCGLRQKLQAPDPAAATKLVSPAWLSIVAR